MYRGHVGSVRLLPNGLSQWLVDVRDHALLSTGKTAMDDNRERPDTTTTVAAHDTMLGRYIVLCRERLSLLNKDAIALPCPLAGKGSVM